MSKCLIDAKHHDRRKAKQRDGGAFAQPAKLAVFAQKLPREDGEQRVAEHEPEADVLEGLGQERRERAKQQAHELIGVGREQARILLEAVSRDLADREAERLVGPERPAEIVLVQIGVGHPGEVGRHKRREAGLCDQADDPEHGGPSFTANLHHSSPPSAQPCRTEQDYRPNSKGLARRRGSTSCQGANSDLRVFEAGGEAPKSGTRTHRAPSVQA